MNRTSKPASHILVNVGCGPIHHSDWTNLDLLVSEGVRYHDIHKPLPFQDKAVDVVYHSHVLEHLTKDEGVEFIRECFRVLRPGGILRIAVPDLEQICREYLANLEAAAQSLALETVQKYQWSMLELFDQIVRTESGGAIPAAIAAGEVPKDYVLARAGDDMAPLFNAGAPASTGALAGLKKIYKRLRSRRFNPQKNGEAHKWMYDRVGLRLLLEDAGFKNFAVKTFDTSSIPEWNTYGLDASRLGNGPRKPDSLFVEVTA